MSSSSQNNRTVMSDSDRNKEAIKGIARSMTFFLACSAQARPSDLTDLVIKYVCLVIMALCANIGWANNDSLRWPPWGRRPDGDGGGKDDKGGDCDPHH